MNTKMRQGGVMERKRGQVERCDNCGIDVVFESYEGSPREYDICDDCCGHFCPSCMKDEGACKLCAEGRA